MTNYLFPSYHNASIHVPVGHTNTHLRNQLNYSTEILFVYTLFLSIHSPGLHIPTLLLILPNPTQCMQLQHKAHSLFETFVFQEKTRLFRVKCTMIGQLCLTYCKYYSKAKLLLKFFTFINIFTTQEPLSKISPGLIFTFVKQQQN